MISVDLEIVKLFRTVEEKEWTDLYPEKIKEEKFLLKFAKLKQFEEDLAHFCYSIYTLKVNCSSYIFRKSNSFLPNIQAMS